MDVKLKLVNKSNNTMNARYVIFQKNLAPNSGGMSVAWRVATELDEGMDYDFTLYDTMKVGASWGDSHRSSREVNISVFINPITAEVGDLIGVLLVEPDLVEIKKVGHANSRKVVQVRNDSPKMKFFADLFRVTPDSEGIDPRMAAATVELAPGEIATFAFEPTIYIGVSWKVDQGMVFEDGDLTSVAEIPLLGISSADIVASGGGPDDGSEPTHFGLANVVR